MKGQNFLTFIFVKKEARFWNLHIQGIFRLFLDPFLATQPVYTKLSQKNRWLGIFKNYLSSCCWKHILWRYFRKLILGSEQNVEPENKE